MSGGRGRVNGRRDGRGAREIRPLRLETGFLRRAPASVLVSQGLTRVLCAASVEEVAPRWKRGKGTGWVTAEYAMLPMSSHDRMGRERRRGVPGRHAEIQRLVGRALRSAVDMRLLGERTVTVDCDVIEADGGTRTAAVTGGFVAIALALHQVAKKEPFSEWPLARQVAGVSVGVVGGEVMLDLDYEEDAVAEVDLNVAQTAGGELIEVQGTAEGRPFGRAVLNEMLDVAGAGIEAICRRQREVLAGIPLPDPV